MIFRYVKQYQITKHTLRVYFFIIIGKVVVHWHFHVTHYALGELNIIVDTLKTYNNTSIFSNKNIWDCQHTTVNYFSSDQVKFIMWGRVTSTIHIFPKIIGHLSWGLSCVLYNYVFYNYYEAYVCECVCMWPRYVVRLKINKLRKREFEENPRGLTELITSRLLLKIYIFFHVSLLKLSRLTTLYLSVKRDIIKIKHDDYMHYYNNFIFLAYVRSFYTLLLYKPIQ